jgi:hypothetical protein
VPILVKLWTGEGFIHRKRKKNKGGAGAHSLQTLDRPTRFTNERALPLAAGSLQKKSAKTCSAQPNSAAFWPLQPTTYSTVYPAGLSIWWAYLTLQATAYFIIAITFFLFILSD